MKKQKTQKTINLDAKTVKRIDKFREREYIDGWNEAVRVLVNKGLDAELVK